jgi:hypothetical protein
LGHTAGRSIVDRLVLIVSLFVDRTLKTDSFLYGCFVASINRVPKMDRLLHLSQVPVLTRDTVYE